MTDVLTGLEIPPQKDPLDRFQALITGDAIRRSDVVPLIRLAAEIQDASSAGQAGAKLLTNFADAVDGSIATQKPIDMLQFEADRARNLLHGITMVAADQKLGPLLGNISPDRLTIAKLNCQLWLMATQDPVKNLKWLPSTPPTFSED